MSHCLCAITSTNDSSDTYEPLPLTTPKGGHLASKMGQNKKAGKRKEECASWRKERKQEGVCKAHARRHSNYSAVNGSPCTCC
eukprot:1136845-Pelagomonas_calceolata.AAC.5